MSIKFSRLERQIIRFVDRQYPIAWERLDSDEIVAIEERQLPSRDDVARHFNKIRPVDISSALKSLIGYQCVKECYLYSRDDYAEICLAAGKTRRIPVAAAGGGIIGLQITSIGKSEIQSFWDYKFKSLLSKWAAKISEEYVPLIISFLLGAILSSAFGIDIKKLLGR